MSNIEDVTNFKDPNEVKVVDRKSDAIYFSESQLI